MIRTVTCVLVECDDCSTALGEEADGYGYTLHFDNHDAALRQLTDQGWTVTENGHIRCPRCSAKVLCGNLGHSWGPWCCCHCNGLIPDHATHGCPLIRGCQQCGFIHASDLADLPTIDEPSIGR